MHTLRSRTKRLALVFMFLSSTTLSAWADESPKAEAPSVTPTVHHKPKIAAPAHKDLELGVQIERPESVKKAWVVYKQDASYTQVPLLRSASGDMPYVAVIEAERVKPPLAYAIELETTSGERIPAFASRQDPQTVALVDDVTDARERHLLSRLDNRRSVVTTSGDWVSFGEAMARVQDPSRPGSLIDREIADGYYRVEGSYTYRTLRTVAQFGIRAGVVRGRSVVPNETDASKFDVGLNYGAPNVRLRATDWLHFDLEFLTSVTEVGFSMGGSAATIVGDAYGTNMTLGVESIAVFGTRGFSRFNIQGGKRWRLAPMVEVSNMPHAEKPGVRLLGEVDVELGQGFGMAVRGGYQARAFAGGGPNAGLSLRYCF